MPETPSSSEREQRLERILADYLHAVEAGTAPDRAALLQQHPDLAADLDSFFRNRDAVQRIAEPIQQQMQEPATIPPSESVSAGVGTVLRYFGDYELLEEIARGGMGVVYKARQLSVNRIVAVKMIRAGQLASAADVARFRAEAMAAANLDHPNIVPIYEVGEHEGQHYFSMKLIEGRNLACQIRPLLEKPREAGRLLAIVARAVHHAHQRGILHRDLKPGNILLEGRAGGANPLVPHITDFGLAKRVHGESGVSTRGDALTQSGAIVGTPSYMPPEQARAEKQLTTAIDVYSLGAILYELLTGRPPFQAPTVLDTVLQVLEQEPASPRSIRPQTDGDLETICLKCLHKNPERRYESAAALADDLERWLRGEPILARPVGTAERLVKWVRRKPAAATLTAMSVLALVLLLVGGLYFNVQLQEQAKRAEKGEADALQQKEKADANAKEATDNAEKEAQERRRADREADAAWTNQYLAHVSLMGSDWENANVGRILDTLELYRKPPPGRKDVRGWEWYYQERLCHQELLTVEGNTSKISRPGSVSSFDGVTGENISTHLKVVVLSPDWTRVATLNHNGTAQVWDAASGEVLYTLATASAAEHSISGLTFSPDGRKLVSASNSDGTVKLWDASTGKKLQTFKRQKNELSPLVISPDAARLASGNAEDRSVKLWDAETGKELHSLKGHTAAVLQVGFSPDGTRLVSSDSDGTVKLWDVATGRKLHTFKGHKSVPLFGTLDLVFSPDGKRLASASAELLEPGNNPAEVKVWDVATGQQLPSLIGHTGQVMSVMFSPDGSRLASASMDGTVMLWDVVAAKELRTLKGHKDGVVSVTFSPDGRRLASAGLDGTTRLWDPDSGQELSALKGIGGVFFSPDGRRLAAIGADRSGWTMMVWDSGSGQDLRKLQGHMDQVFSVAFSPDGTRLAAACGDGTVKLWDVVSGQPLHTLKGHTKWVSSVAFSPDGKRLVTAGSTDRAVKLWDVATGQQLRILPDFAVSCVAFSPDGKRVIAGGQSVELKLWDVDGGQDTRTLELSDYTVNGLAFSPDGKRLALASDDMTVKLCNAATGQELHTLKGHTAQVEGVAFSPDGTHLASASWDGTVKLWNATTGQELHTLRGHMERVDSVAFNREGSRVASASRDKTVKLWAVDSGQELRTLNAHTRLGCVAFSPDGMWLASAGAGGTVKLWDARPLSPEVKAEVEAVGLLDTLFAKPLPKSDVRAAIREQRFLSPAARQKALELADRYHEETDPQKYYATAWPVLRHPVANVFVEQTALAQMKAAFAKAPHEDKYQIALAVAHYRLGKFQKEHYHEALGLLAKCDPDQPATLAFLAMTQYQLGQKAEAQATLARLRKLLQTPERPKDQESQSFLAEAETLMQSAR
jgi:WD40 repeat protein/tRNA A-37 threonylcarbamoyl transferase component Bud32